MTMMLNREYVFDTMKSVDEMINDNRTGFL